MPQNRGVGEQFQKFDFFTVHEAIKAFALLAPHNGPKSLILAPQDITDISGYQLVFGCQCVKAYNNENPVTNQKIL